VGSLDGEVLELNRAAYARLPGTKALVVVPGASHLFEEPGTLAVVSNQASAWFTQHLMMA
jgi:PhoPQ-activated pathogenicity-related protein